MSTIANDISRCMGAGFTEDGIRQWREGCEDCLRRTEKGGEHTPYIAPPAIIAFVCELRIKP